MYCTSTEDMQHSCGCHAGLFHQYLPSYEPLRGGPDVSNTLTFCYVNAYLNWSRQAPGIPAACIRPLRIELTSCGHRALDSVCYLPSFAYYPPGRPVGESFDEDITTAEGAMFLHSRTKTPGQLIVRHLRAILSLDFGPRHYMAAHAPQRTINIVVCFSLDDALRCSPLSLRKFPVSTHTRVRRRSWQLVPQVPSCIFRYSPWSLYNYTTRMLCLWAD